MNGAGLFFLQSFRLSAAMIEPIHIYLVLVGLSGIFIVWWSRRGLTKAEKSRSSRIKRLKPFQSIKTTTPIKTPVIDAKETALDSVENRFSIIRKLTFFTLVSIWIFALVFPFLNNIPAAFVSILITVSGIIIGVAARPFIENLISGIVISFSKPIRVGDTVLIDENYGTIEDITITHTIVKIWNWRRYIVPNSRMLSKEIINCTINDTYQWVHVEFFVAYESDLEIVKSLAIQSASGSRYFADHEAPKFWVMEMNEKGFKCWLAAWADTPTDAWELANDIRTNLITQFRESSIKSHRIEVNTGSQVR